MIKKKTSTLGELKTRLHISKSIERREIGESD
jgi:hypothetical protein